MTRIVVRGEPAPQGSKRPLRNKHTGRVQLVESSSRVATWRADVRAAVLDQAPDVHYDGPVAVRIAFALRRPKSHYGAGRNATQLRQKAPRYPTGRQDVDKLARAVLDALVSAGLLRDDGQVVELQATKVYARLPSAEIVVLERPRHVSEVAA